AVMVRLSGTFVATKEW
ncbi:hypothetical protein D047_3385B, partial [Vibrio parahaemolyticus VPTS-2010_2]